MLLLQARQDFLSVRPLLQGRLRTRLCLLGVLDHGFRIQQCFLDLAPHLLALLRALLEFSLSALELFATDVHDLTVQLADLLLHSMMLHLNVVQLALPGGDDFLQLLEFLLVVLVQRWDLQGLEPTVEVLHLLGQAFDLHVALLLAQVEVLDLSISELQCLLQGLLFLPNRVQPRVSLLVRRHDLLDFLWAVEAQGGAHAALGHLMTAAAHRTAGVDQLARKRDHAPALTALDANACGLIQVLGDQSVLHREKEGDGVLGLCGLNQIDQPRHSLRRLHRHVHLALPLPDLLQGDTGGATEVIPADEFDHCLRI
mmetsp:Transcript_75399/g.190677  ORF Transcript_75399/g.190677 Transcript_75399/m.190677 type:complete len:313 (-) Transcript_75399:1384-2322(-)